ncbi:MAG TPA: response regulator transcription factor [Gemmatimonadaceae bacterium]|nr:response regulator transcription factor [Gemmatimonadaceae bacterium]
MTAGTRLLIIEDNRNLALGLRTAFSLEGYEVDVAADGEAGLLQARYANPAAIILDLMLPKRDGYQVLAALRQAGIVTPVVILTARTEEADKLRGFRSGADDYVTKPFSILELSARVEALLRRAACAYAGTREKTRGSVEQFGEVEIHLDSRRVLRRGAPVALRPMEYDLLVTLVRRRGEVLSRAELLRLVWAMQADVVTRTVDIHVAELRRKLEDDPAAPRHILTVRKVGYQLSA